MTQRFMARRATPIATATAAVCALSVFAAGSVQAQSAGSLLLRAGATQIKPNVSSGDLTPPSFAGTQADIRADTQFAGGLTRPGPSS